MTKTVPVVDPSRGIDQSIKWISESEWPEAEAAGMIRAERFFMKHEADIANLRRRIESEVVVRRLDAERPI